jgi:hypothetical protein
MDDLLLKRADTILADNRAVRARIREELLQARIGMARIRATVLMARAERETSRSIRTELHAVNQESMPQERERERRSRSEPLAANQKPLPQGE